MKEINGYLLVGEIPEGQRYFDLYGNENQQEIVYNKMTAPGKFKTVYISLPKGNYSIIGLAKDLKVEQYEDVIEYVEANNLNPNTTLILKKENQKF